MGTATENSIWDKIKEFSTKILHIETKLQKTLGRFNQSIEEMKLKIFDINQNGKLDPPEKAAFDYYKQVAQQAMSDAKDTTKQTQIFALVQMGIQIAFLLVLLFTQG